MGIRMKFKHGCLTFVTIGHSGLLKNANPGPSILFYRSLHLFHENCLGLGVVSWQYFDIYCSKMKGRIQL